MFLKVYDILQMVDLTIFMRTVATLASVFKHLRSCSSSMLFAMT